VKLEGKGGDYPQILFTIIVVERGYIVNEKGPATLDDNASGRSFVLAIQGYGMASEGGSCHHRKA